MYELPKVIIDYNNYKINRGELITNIGNQVDGLTQPQIETIVGYTDNNSCYFNHNDNKIHMMLSKGEIIVNPLTHYIENFGNNPKKVPKQTDKGLSNGGSGSGGGNTNGLVRIRNGENYHPIVYQNNSSIYCYGALPSHSADNNITGGYHRYNHWIYIPRKQSVGPVEYADDWNGEGEALEGLIRVTSGSHFDQDFSIISGQDHSNRNSIIVNRNVPSPI
jgi:hypothetical protein